MQDVDVLNTHIVQGSTLIIMYLNKIINLDVLFKAVIIEKSY